MVHLDPKYYLVAAAAVILALIFIKYLWKFILWLVIFAVLAGVGYWYFLHHR